MAVYGGFSAVTAIFYGREFMIVILSILYIVIAVLSGVYFAVIADLECQLAICHGDDGEPVELRDILIPAALWPLFFVYAVYQLVDCDG